MENKITIFLDIDGVLATHKQWDLKLSSPLRLKDHNNAYPFDQKCVKVLNEILSTANFEIVLHTDWIYHFDLNEMQEIFEINGVSQGPTRFTGMNYSMDKFRDRLLRITRFIEEERIKRFIILDDINLESRLFGDKFIHVENDMEGIKQSGLKERILKKIESFS